MKEIDKRRWVNLWTEGLTMNGALIRDRFSMWLNDYLDIDNERYNEDWRAVSTEVILVTKEVLDVNRSRT